MFEHYPDNTTFEFGDAQLAADGWWRVITNNVIAITSGDNARQVGVPRPVDVRREAIALLAEHRVEAARVTADGDLVLRLDGGVRLEVLASSAAYESWNLTAPGHHLVAMPGGRVSDFS